MPYYDCFMLDVETTGTRPDLNHVIEISVVAFDPITQQRDEGITLNLSKDQAGRGVDQQTLSWWKGQSETVKQSVFKNFLLNDFDNRAELDKLNAYVLKHRDPCAKPVFWSKPLHFDYMFVQGIYKDLGVYFPFPYYITIDMWSYCAGLLNFDRAIYESLKPERIDAHSSLADIHWQLDWLFEVQKYVNAKPKD